MKWMALLLFGGLGLFAVIAGGIWGASRYALHHDGLRAQGLVVENFQSVSVETDKSRNKYESVSYYPIVEFQAQNGKTIRVRGSTGSGVPEFQVGQPLRVIYEASSPYDAQIDSFEQLWLGPVAVLVSGFALLVMGIGGFVLIRQSDAKLDEAESRMKRDMQELSARAKADPRFGSVFDRE